jgi:hypothetical protein
LNRLRRAKGIFVTCLGGALLAACGLCHNDTLSTATSPDGRFEATAFLRYCSGPNGYSTHVSVVATGMDLENEPGNVMSVAGRYPFTVEWHGNDVLVIHGVKGVLPERMFDRIGDIRIYYTETPMPRPKTPPLPKTFRDRPHHPAGRSGR